jgi:hypothetical protein
MPQDSKDGLEDREENIDPQPKIDCPQAFALAVVRHEPIV